MSQKKTNIGAMPTPKRGGGADNKSTSERSNKKSQAKSILRVPSFLQQDKQPNPKPPQLIKEFEKEDAFPDQESSMDEGEKEVLDLEYEDFVDFEVEAKASMRKKAIGGRARKDKKDDEYNPKVGMAKRNLGGRGRQQQQQGYGGFRDLDDDLQDLGPYEGDYVPSEDEVDFDQGFDGLKIDDKKQVKQARKSKGKVLWDMVDSVKAADLPTISQNAMGGPRLLLAPDELDNKEMIKRYKEELRPIDAFNLFWPEELYAMMFDQMFIYKDQQLEKKVFKKIKVAWEKFTVRDVKNFIGVFIWMGIHRLPHLQSHWSYDILYQTSFGMCMGRNTFEFMNQIFHLADNEKANKKDPLYKLRPFMNILEQKFVEMYDIGENVTVDEAMVKWKGQLFFKQLMKGKPIKWGIKLFLLCDAKNGYCHSFKVYTGKRDDMKNFGDWEETRRYLETLKYKNKNQGKKAVNFRSLGIPKDGDVVFKVYKSLSEPGLQPSDEMGPDGKMLAYMERDAFSEDLEMFQAYHEKQKEKDLEQLNNFSENDLKIEEPEPTIIRVDDENPPAPGQLYRSKLREGQSILLKPDIIEPLFDEDEHKDGLLNVAGSAVSRMTDEATNRTDTNSVAEKKMEDDDDIIKIEDFESGGGQRSRSKKDGSKRTQSEDKKKKGPYMDAFKTPEGSIRGRLPKEPIEEEKEVSIVSSNRSSKKSAKKGSKKPSQSKKEEVDDEVIEVSEVGSQQIASTKDFLNKQIVPSEKSEQSMFPFFPSNLNQYKDESQKQQSLLGKSKLTDIYQDQFLYIDKPMTDKSIHTIYTNKFQNMKKDIDDRVSVQSIPLSYRSRQFWASDKQISDLLHNQPAAQQNFAQKEASSAYGEWRNDDAYEFMSQDEDMLQFEVGRLRLSDKTSSKKSKRKSKTSNDGFDVLEIANNLIKIEEEGLSKGSKKKGARAKKADPWKKQQKQVVIPEEDIEDDLDYISDGNASSEYRGGGGRSQKKKPARPKPKSIKITQELLDKAQSHEQSSNADFANKRRFYEISDDNPSAPKTQGQEPHKFQLINFFTLKKRFAEYKETQSQIQSEVPKVEESEVQIINPPPAQSSKRSHYDILKSNVNNPIDRLESDDDEVGSVVSEEGFQVSKFSAKSDKRGKPKGPKKIHAHKTPQSIVKGMLKKSKTASEKNTQSETRGDTTTDDQPSEIIIDDVRDPDIIIDEEEEQEVILERQEKRDLQKVNITFTRRSKPQDTLSKFVIDTLIAPWEDRKLTIYMDNFYTSTQLFRDLLVRGKACCGTIRANRLSGLPAFEKPKQGDFIFFRHKEVKEMYLVLYHDTKPVWLLTTKHTPLYSEIKNKGWRGNVMKEKIPHLVEEYNQFTHGVDMNNMHTARYRYPHRSSKWWKALFQYFLQLVVANCQTWYLQVTGRQKNALKFREDLVRGIIVMKPRGRQIHFPEYLSKKNFKERKYLTCRRCTKLTPFYCPTCSGHQQRVCLCVPGCYRDHHMELEKKHHAKINLVERPVSSDEEME